MQVLSDDESEAQSDAQTIAMANNPPKLVESEKV